MQESHIQKIDTGGSCSYIYGSEAADKRLILSTVSVGSVGTVKAAQSDEVYCFVDVRCLTYCHLLGMYICASPLGHVN